MDIVIISQYLRNIEDFDGNNSRFVYLAKLLEKEHNVEIITSDFMHKPKAHAKSVGPLGNVQVTTLHEPGYAKNVSLQRFASHKALANNLKTYLKGRKKPDMVYVAVPSLDVAGVAADYCRKNGVKFVVDIQDLWPEAFLMVFNIPVLSKLLFKPMELLANKIYAAADRIVAVSETYVQRGLRVNKRGVQGSVVYLGTDKDVFDSYCDAQPGRQDDVIEIAYIGSLAASYDLDTAIDAIAQLKTDRNVRFVVMGDGARKASFEEHAKAVGICCEFTGSLPYPEMVKRLCSCDIAVNPIRKGSAGSVINKVNDYAMAGLPVINSQECLEYRDLLDEYEAGINCVCQDVQSMAAALKQLVEDDAQRAQMGVNSRKLGEEQFDRSYTYRLLANKLVGKE